MDPATPRAVGRRRPAIPFRLKLSLVGAALALVPLAVVGALLLEVNADAVRRNARELQLAVADDVARTIDASFVDVQDGLDAVGRVLVDRALDPEATERLVLDLVASREHLDHAIVYDAEGGLVDVVREEAATLPPPSDPLPAALRELAERDNVGTGRAVRAAGSPRVPVVVPLRVGEVVTGFVATQASLAPVQRRLDRLAELRFGDRDDAIFVIDEDQRLLAHADASRAAELPSVAGRGILEGIDRGAVTGRFQISSEHASAAGVPMVGTLVGLRTKPWAVAVQVPREVAYASYTTMRRIVLSTLVVVVMLALLVAFLAARQITRPIETLTAFANDLAERRFDRRVTLQTRDELSVLGDVMSAAAADLAASEERLRREAAIRHDLGRYLPADLVDKVVRREQDMNLGGSRRDVTVLFADVVAFTPLTDELSAEEVVALLNELFTILTEIVFRHGGTVDKFIGDCVMAMWGAPRDMPDHAARALAAAEDMMRWLEAGNEAWRERHGVVIQLAIGINSGEAIVGNVGSETRMEFTAIGDTVNVAARLESIARPSQILATEATRVLAGEGFDFLDLGERTLSGRSEPVHLHEVRA
ncbi:MAG: adenylate/guanylate cyclase domain-containing protein [Myxococcota bacterium]